jgi:hypothetical protein
MKSYALRARRQITAAFDGRSIPSGCVVRRLNTFAASTKWLAAAFTLTLLGACGGSSTNRLYGSACTTFNCDFDRVEVKRQDANGTLHAIIVEYVYGPGTGSQHSPVKIVANAPVTQAQEKDLTKEGALTRVMPDGSQFPTMKEGKITFDELGDVGKTAAGRFYITFDKTGTTLDGEFSATLQQL